MSSNINTNVTIIKVAENSSYADAKSAIENNSKIVADAKSANKHNIKVALSELNKMINAESLINANFAKMKNKDKSNYMANYKLDNKDTLIKLVAKMKAENLTIRLEQSVSALKDAYRFYTKSEMAKSSFSSEDKFISALKDARKKENIAKCKKIADANK